MAIYVVFNIHRVTTMNYAILLTISFAPWYILRASSSWLWRSSKPPDLTKRDHLDIITPYALVPFPISKQRKQIPDQMLLRFFLQTRQLTRPGTQSRVLRNHLLSPQQASFELFCHLGYGLPSLTADIVAMIAVEIAATIHLQLNFLFELC